MEPLTKVSAEIYMKSGNVIHLDRLEEISVKRNANGKAIEMSWTFEEGYNKKILFIDLEEVESVISLKQP